AQLPPHRELDRTGDAEHVRRAAAERRHPNGGALSHRGETTHSGSAPGRGRRDERRGLRAERNLVVSVVAHDRRIACGRLSVQRRASDPDNSGTRRSGIVSPKGGVVIGPFNGTEFYVNGGFG